MAYYAHTHKADKIARKHLFRINGVSFEDMLENISILLDDDASTSTSTIANLPTNKDALLALKTPNNDVTMLENAASPVVGVNEMCVVVWKNCDSEYEWFIGYVKSLDKKKGIYNIDHLHRVTNGSHSKWKYPSKADLQPVEPEQIMKCDIDGQ